MTPILLRKEEKEEDDEEQAEKLEGETPSAASWQRFVEAVSGELSSEDEGEAASAPKRQRVD